MKDMDEKINSIRENVSNSSVTKEKLESQIQVLNEQIKAAEMTDEHLQSRLSAIEKDKQERLESKQGYDEKKAVLEEQLAVRSSLYNHTEAVGGCLSKEMM